MKTKILGRTGLNVPIVGLGTAFIGIPTPEQAAREYKGASQMIHELGVKTVVAALNAGCTLIDTAVIYGRTQSEKMIGEALQLCPKLAKQCIVTTKVGKCLDLSTFNYNADFITRSVEESLARLKLKRIEIVYVHDAMGASMQDLFGKGKIVDSLRILQKRGLVRFIGTASNDPEVNADLIETGEFDVAVVCEAWSLLNQLAYKRILPAAERHNVGLVIAAPLERGLLATGPVHNMIYDDRNFSQTCLEHVVKIKKLCEKHGISMAAAALQWCTRHPQVASTIPGARLPEEAVSNIKAGEMEIPESFWDDLKPLIRNFEKGNGR
ncbi:MAG: aldo/keto reductase [Candidatus Taylorbacteria bacterium]|nr:aldo/keto reductase [Candidatus Taylorbacteria bacterium]